VWALLYFPGTGPDGEPYDVTIAGLERSITQPRAELTKAEAELMDLEQEGDKDTAKIASVRENLKMLEEKLIPMESTIKKLHSDWKGQSCLGRIGKTLEPVVEPLGWDWRIGMAALASFPAREVIVGTMGIIFSEGQGEAGEAAYRDRLGHSLKGQTWDNDPERKLFTVPVALSVMVFFALCCQCASTLAVIKRETNSWTWPAFTFVYMTVLAYGGAFLVFQIGNVIL
jgi:ferrous iron transport protein B